MLTMLLKPTTMHCGKLTLCAKYRGVHIGAAAPSGRPIGRRSSGGRAGVCGAPRAMSTDFAAMIETKNAENAVMVYSKTYCPYCAEVKSLFSRLSVPAKIVELDELADGAAVQAALKDLTGRGTVPQVFIGGKHIGGCDGELGGGADADQLPEDIKA